MLTALAITVPSAWAHHPVVSGEVKCATDGTAVVTWHLTNSETVSGTNRTMVVDTATLTSGTLTGIAAGTKVGPQTAAGIPTVNGSSSYPGNQTGTVTLTIAAHWIESNGNPTTVNATNSATVTLPGTCKTPSDPHASIDNSCADGGVKVVLSNTGQTATSFDVFKNGTKIDTVAVAGAGSVTKIYPMAEDETAVFRAKADKFDSGDVSVTHDCTNPSASIANSCADGGVKVVLHNGGQNGTSFDVFKNGTKIDTVAVGAGATVTKIYAMAEDETATYNAKADNYDSGPISVTHDCTKPGASIVNSCVDGGVRVVLTNGGVNSTTFDVFKNGTKIDTVTVAAGGSTTKVYAMTEDETANYRAKADNYDSGDVSVTHDCTNPAAAITNSCSAGGVVFKLTNTGLLPVSFELTKNGSHLDTVNVAAAGSATKTYAMAEDETATFRAKGSNFDSKDVQITHNCTNPGAVVADSCSAGGAVVSLTNTGVSPESFDVYKGGTKIDTVPVGANASVTKVYTLAEDETATFRVKTADGFDSGDKSLTHNCTNPAAVVANSCTAGGAVFTLTNTGSSSDSFDISRNGTKVDTALVAAGGTVSRTYAMAEDETAVFRATTADGFDSGNKTITHNCTSPAASVVNSCSAGGAAFTLSNGGPSPVTFAVTKDGAATDSVLVNGFATVTKTYPMAEDEKASFAATTAGFNTGAISITHDCQPTQVLGVQFNQPLPRTGTNVLPTFLRGLALLLLGFVLVKLARTKTT
ncbi:MAG: hypothetical protein JO054_05535 [Actinobacteria bacterium]|nr:hypothetical protein [Actinomycetota bacterium]